MTTPAERAPTLCRLGMAPTGEQHGKTVAMTFDDGPDPINTPKVLATLRAHDVKATFFVTGKAVRAHPDLVRRIVAEGHTLGNHTDTHPSLPGLSEAKIRFQLSATQTSVNEALGYTYPLIQVRPPYGANNQRVRDVIEDEGRCMVLWDVDSNDWKYSANDAKLFANVFAGDYSVARKGGVILMHDVHPQTARVLSEMLDKLEDEGFTFTTTGQLLEQKYPEPDAIAPSVR